MLAMATGLSARLPFCWAERQNEFLRRSAALVTTWAVEESLNWIRRDAVLTSRMGIFGRCSARKP